MDEMDEATKATLSKAPEVTLSFWINKDCRNNAGPGDATDQRYQTHEWPGLNRAVHALDLAIDLGMLIFESRCSIWIGRGRSDQRSH
jgi:hypothetical protein